MDLYEKLLNGKEKISVLGLGYVGMPIAVAFSEKVRVIGYDINKKKTELLKKGIDKTNEVGSEKLKNSNIEFTSDETRLKESKFFIIAVPTPINSDKTPDFTPVISVSKTVGRNLTKGSIVVYESTVYPGVTEDMCVPILEKESGLKCGIDFKIGYSPERINPGDKKNKLESIVKIVSGMDDKALDIIAKVYEIIIKAGVYKASSIKVAEAAKVTENSQRDINIAFMNEMAMVFERMGIDTKEVIEAMNTKWNALGFYPGLVGGHCIAVDPYYFIYKAEKLGYHSQIVLSGRKINDSMAPFIADIIIKRLILTNKKVKNARVAIFGATFKENTPDIRNSKIIDIVSILNDYGIEPIITDPFVDAHEAKTEYGIEITDINDIKDIDCLVLAVGHDEFKKMDINFIDSFFADLDNSEKIIIDVKSILDKSEVYKKKYNYWSL
jgi:UDP-N-acetyl-D-galactosamine dehydrogenase